MTIQQASAQQGAPAKTATVTSSPNSQHTDDDFAEAMKLIGAQDEAEEGEDGDPSDDRIPVNGRRASDEDMTEEFEEAAAKLENPDTEEEPAKKASDEIDLDPEKYDKLLDKRRQLWQTQKKVQEERKALAQERAELEALRKSAKNPPKGEGQDPIETLLDDEEEEWLPPSKLKEKIRKEIMEDLKKEREQEMSAAEEEAQVDLYKSKIADHVAAHEDKFPISNTFLDPEEIQEQAFAFVEQDFNAKAEKYGYEYAAENIMSEATAAALLEKKVAQKYAPRLKSEKNQKLLRQFLGTQKDSKQPVLQTLSNEVRNASLPDDGPQDWDDRVKWAANKFVKES
jgi:hypothetical protein